jgi:hypothetical protein
MSTSLWGTSLWAEVLAMTADKPLWLVVLVSLAAMIIHKGPDYLKVMLEHRRSEARLSEEQTRNRTMIEEAIAEALKRHPARPRRRP